MTDDPDVNELVAEARADMTAPNGLASAVEALSGGIERSPNAGRLWLERARLRAAVHNWHRDAFIDICRALELTPDAPDVLLWDFVIRRRVGQTRGLWNRALAAADVIADVDGSDVRVFLEELLDLLKIDEGELNNYLTANERVATAHRLPEAYAHLSEGYRRAGRDDDANTAQAKCEELAGTAAATMLMVVRVAHRGLHPGGTEQPPVPVTERLAELSASELRSLLHSVIALFEALPEHAESDALQSRGDFHSFVCELSKLAHDLRAGTFYAPDWLSTESK